MVIVVDASVAAAWFVPEPVSEAARHLLATSKVLLAPDMLRIEVASALLKAQRRRMIDAGQAEGSLDRLPRLVALQPSDGHVDAAFVFARTYGGSLYDGIYAVIAREHAATLATNDRALANVARGAGIQTILLSDHMSP